MALKLSLSLDDQRALGAFLQDLVRIPSPSTQEGEAARRLADEMRRVGFSEVFVDRIGDVVGRIGAGHGPKLLYNGHLDTVRVADASLWQWDPLSAKIQDGVLYGLGAVDMKGALAAMVYGAKAVIDSGIQLAGDLYVVGVVQEETCEGLAMRILVEEEGIRPDYVILGEATNLQIARGQRGRIELKVTTFGSPAHASAPERGENAIYGAAKVIVGLELLASQLDEDPFLGKGTVAVTQIESHAGSRNAIPEICRLYIDRRLVSGETAAKAAAEVKRIIAREQVRSQVEVTQYSADSYTGYRCQAEQYFAPWTLPENAPLVQKCAEVIEDVLGSVPTIGRWAFSTDGVYTAGIAGIPTIGFGPGEERFAHAANEQVRLQDVLAAAEVYANLPLVLLSQRD